jgi:hypothetical protein
LIKECLRLISEWKCCVGNSHERICIAQNRR